MAVDYSAMVDHLENPGGIPIKVGKFFYEPVIETEQKRALPDTNDFVTKLDRFLKMSMEKRAELGQKTREYITEPVETFGETEKFPRYSWERTTAIWMNAIAQIEIEDQCETWLRPEPKINKPNLTMSKPNMNNAEFVRWMICDILQKPELSHTQFAGDWIQALNCGFVTQGNNMIPFNREELVKRIMAMVQYQNNMETKRVDRNKSKNKKAFDVVTI